MHISRPSMNIDANPFKDNQMGSLADIITAWATCGCMVSGRIAVSARTMTTGGTVPTASTSYHPPHLSPSSMFVSPCLTLGTQYNH